MTCTAADLRSAVVARPAAKAGIAIALRAAASHVVEGNPISASVEIPHVAIPHFEGYQLSFPL